VGEREGSAHRAADRQNGQSAGREVAAAEQKLMIAPAISGLL